jgi:hypothetical protein
MPEFNPKARETTRGEHPDLVRGSNGELEFRDDIDLPRNERDFYRMWSDPDQRAAFMARVAQRQAELPQDVQDQVAGKTYDGYAGSGDPYWGYREYLTVIEQVRSPTEFTAADVERMSLEEFDQHFERDGRPKPGVTYEANLGGRDIDVSGSGIDPFSAREWRNR